MYLRGKYDLEPGTFKLIGDSIEILPSYIEKKIKINFEDEIEEIQKIDPKFESTLQINEISIYPNSIFILHSDEKIIQNILNDLNTQKKILINNNQTEEAERLEKRTELDVEMIKELGYCLIWLKIIQMLTTRRKRRKTILFI